MCIFDLGVTSDCEMSLYVVVALFTCFRVCSFSILLPKFNDSTSNVATSKSDLVMCKGRLLELPTYWDWRLHKGVSSVKDQMGCGACYAFSALANIESQIMIRQPTVGEVDLSEQFIIDCNDQNAKCHGASIIKTFADIIVNMGGVLEEADYCPYENRSDVCRWDGDKSLMHAVIGFQRIHPGNEDEMKKYIVCHGPLSAAINAQMMKKYEPNSGVIDQPTKNQCRPELKYQHHAVLIVGYGVYESPNKKHKVPYWIIKNSWGEDWGNDGYYYLERGTNACGVANDVSFVIVPHD